MSKFPSAFALLALAVTGVTTASAANVTDWGALGPVPDVAYVTSPQATGAIDDVYTFSIGGVVQWIDAYGEEFEARSVTMRNATFTLFAGAYGSGDAVQVGQPFGFGNTATETRYLAPADGDYYFEVEGTSALAGSGYDFEAFSGIEADPVAVPEPANAALMLAGLGAVGWIARRRRRA